MPATLKRHSIHLCGSVYGMATVCQFSKQSRVPASGSAHSKLALLLADKIITEGLFLKSSAFSCDWDMNAPPISGAPPHSSHPESPWSYFDLQAADVDDFMATAEQYEAMQQLHDRWSAGKDCFVLVFQLSYPMLSTLCASPALESSLLSHFNTGSSDTPGVAVSTLTYLCRDSHKTGQWCISPLP
ncbi:hypothetical protein BJ742DRAFT_765982 [Cladochytrium replicatum]|nr:hypothetical protein BJ742DRAFT_765982 [Cladochytrium replicatum]